MPKKDPKKEEERQGRLVTPKDLHSPDPNTLGAPSREGSRSRSRLGGRSGRKNKKKNKKEKKSVGLFVTKELNLAIETTKATVERIARDCRSKNKRYRDTEFDLEYDEWRCLQGYEPEEDTSSGKDVQRVTEIFDKPVFFPQGGAANSTAIKQGSLGDCYFLSALATVSGLPGLMEKICVARDEEVGVYGFIFYQDRGWVSVIVDDMLFTNIPKYESLDAAAKGIYHEDKERFEAIARKGGHVLTYAKSGTSDETWVPIIEKAYAKLYGCYAHIVGGQTREAVEDLTGGISTELNTRDILNTDKFWKEELCKVNKDRIFACAFDAFDAPEDDYWGQAPEVQGLHGGHAYAVLRAVEVNHKRFVIVRNPWGMGEWTGPWSDGSKEWTAEWLKLLPQMKHTFGDDGQFLMEYKDFLKYFTSIDRVLLFDDSWTVASCWLDVPTPPIPAAPAYGTLSFQVTIPKKTKAIFVLSTLNTRSFNSIEQKVHISFEFSVVKIGDKFPLSTASPARPFSTRSATIEIDLEAGEYIVYVKLEQHRILDPESDYAKWDLCRPFPDLVNPMNRVISKILTNKVKALSITQNWDGVGETDYLVKTLEEVIQEELDEINGVDSEEDDDDDEDEDGSNDGWVSDDGSEGAGEKPSDSKPEEEKKEGADAETGEKEGANAEETKEPGTTADGVTGEVTLTVPDDGGDAESNDSDEVSPVEWLDLLEGEGEAAALGLRVYTKTRDPALIVGRIKSADGNWQW